jgi:Family of unknown function (DUF6261)
MFRLSLKGIPAKSKGEACLQVVELLRKHISDDVIVTELGNKMVQAGDILITSLGPKNEIELTRKIKELDEQRDDSFRSLVYGFRMHTHLPVEENKTKAQLILDYLLTENLGFLNYAYMTESSILKEKIEYLEKEENLAFITEIHLLPSFESLKTSNDEFNKLYHQRITEKTNRPENIHISTYPLDSLLRSVYYYLRGTEFDQELTKLIFEPVVRARKRKDNTEEPVTPA